MVGLVDNRPSTNLSKNDTLHLTRYIWHVTCDMWLVTYDMWHMMGGEHSLKMSAPQLIRLGIDSVLKIWRKSISEWLNELINYWQRCLLKSPASVKYRSHANILVYLFCYWSRRRREWPYIWRILKLEGKQQY